MGERRDRPQRVKAMATPRELWRLEATHIDGRGVFVRYFTMDAAIDEETALLERFGWHADCNRVRLDIGLLDEAVLLSMTWPLAADSDILWWLRALHEESKAARAARELGEIIEQRKARPK